MHAKDYRPVGQGQNGAKIQLVAVGTEAGFNMLWDLPTIPGQLPKIADVFRTTPEEKGLTLGGARCHNESKAAPYGIHSPMWTGAGTLNLQRVRVGWAFLVSESREVMNVRQASQYLGISPDTLYRYITEGEIPAFKLGNRWKLRKTILDRWMERKMSQVVAKRR